MITLMLKGAASLAFILFLTSWAFGWPVEESRYRRPCASFVTVQEPFLDCEVRR